MGKPARRQSPEKRAYHHRDLRRALLDAAVELAQQDDVLAFTLREVARRAGVSHAAPYHHFKSKAEIAAAVAKEGYERLYEIQTQAAEAAPADPVEKLRALGVAYVEFALKNPGHFRVMFRMDAGEWADSPVLAESAQRNMVLVSSVIARVVEERDLDVDVMEMTLAAWSVAHGLATLWVDGPLRRTRIFNEDGMHDLARKVIATSTEPMLVAAPRPARSEKAASANESGAKSTSARKRLSKERGTKAAPANEPGRKTTSARKAVRPKQGGTSAAPTKRPSKTPAVKRRRGS